MRAAAVLLSACALAAISCTGFRGDPVPDPAWSRIRAPSRADEGAVESALGVEVDPGTRSDAWGRFELGLGGGWTAGFEAPLITYRESGRGAHFGGAGDRVLSLERALAPREPSGRRRPDAWPFGDLTLRALWVGPAGVSAPARVPGLVEGEEAFALEAASLWRAGGYGLGFMLGAAEVGRAGRGGKGPRWRAGLALDAFLPASGLFYATEESRFRVEAAVTRDPLTDRDLVELSAGLSIALGSWRWELAWRRGLLDLERGDRFFVGFETRFVEVWF